MYREQSVIPSLLVMKCVNLGPQKTGGERDIHICIPQVHKEEQNIIIELHECVFVCVLGCVRRMNQKKHIFKLTSKTFLKADHFPINDEKNLIKERNL